jgi:NAD dependent epimerase/dehydratase family enzyme
LAELTREWEAESTRASQFGARVVTLRFGIILAGHGGALPSMALPFRLGLGGRVGSGQQWTSWVTLDDIVAIIRYALVTNTIKGPANAVGAASHTKRGVCGRPRPRFCTGRRSCLRLLSPFAWLWARWPTPYC